MSLGTLVRHPSRIFYGWRMLAVAGLMGGIDHGLFFRGFMVFFLPVSESLHLSRAATSLVFSLARSEGAFEGPIVGWFIDRFGARRMVLVGIVMAGVGFFMFSLANNFLTFIIAQLVLISIGATMAFQHSMMAAINMWFIRYRALAMSILIASYALGGAILVPLLNLIIQGPGWRTAAVVAGVIYLVVLLPLSLFLRRSPESMGLEPDGIPGEGVREPHTAVSPGGEKRREYYDSLDFTVGEALRTRAYWFLLLGTVFRQTAKSALTVHLVPILVWRGSDALTAGWLVSLWLFASVPARIGFGWIGDRLPKGRLLATGMSLEVVAVLLLLVGGNLGILLLFVVLAGVAEGASPLNTAAIGDFFGRRFFATLRGVVTLSYSWVAMGSPVLAGWWYDRTGDYGLALLVVAIFYGASALAFSVMRKPARPAGKRPTTPRCEKRIPLHLNLLSFPVVPLWKVGAGCAVAP